MGPFPDDSADRLTLEKRCIVRQKAVVLEQTPLHAARGSELVVVLLLVFGCHHGDRDVNSACALGHASSEPEK